MIGDEFPTREHVVEAAEALVTLFENGRSGDGKVDLDIEYWCSEERESALILTLITLGSTLFQIAADGHDDHDDDCPLRADNLARDLRGVVPSIVSTVHAVADAGLLDLDDIELVDEDD